MDHPQGAAPAAPLAVQRHDTIQLDPADVIAEGGERQVFVHPDNPHQLIKVLKHRPTEEFFRWTFGHLSQRYWPTTRYRPTAKQYDEYRRLMMQHAFDLDFDLPISHLYGFVKTNLGVGCITERITDSAGNTAQNLRERMLARSFTEADLDGLNHFVTRLYEVSVCVGDVGPANFVYGHRHIGPKGAKSAPTWVLVDGFGDRFAITIRTYSKYARTRGLDSRFRKGKKVAGLVWQPEARRFTFAKDYTPVD